MSRNPARVSSLLLLLCALALAACGGGTPPPTPNPMPSISSLSPPSGTAGGSAFTLTVNGSGFVSTSVVRWNGSNRFTTFVSSARLDASINGSDIASAGTAQVTVFNTTPGGGTSNAATFPFDNPLPTVTSLSPASAFVGRGVFSLAVVGANFVSSSVVRFNGTDRTTTFVNSTRLDAVILSADTSSPDIAQVTVFNPAPVGGTSNSIEFPITGTIRVSVANDGTQANGPSSQFISSFAVSATGRFVAFESDADNLVTGDTNVRRDIFLRDTCFGAPGGCVASTIRVSVASDGTEAIGGNSSTPSLSADGRFVAFQSDATNLVTADTNGVTDVFVRDRDTDGNGIFDELGAVATLRVSLTSFGTEATGGSSSFPAISADGRFVAFQSDATNLVTGDTNGLTDVFVRDRGPGLTVRVSVDANGVEGNSGSLRPSISATGRFVAFESGADNLVANDTNGSGDVFVHDRDADLDSILDEPGGISTARVSIASDGTQGNATSDPLSLSADGRFVAFESLASNLVANDTNSVADIFVRDTCVGGPGGCIASTVRVSVASDGTEANTFSSGAAVSGGRFIGDPVTGRFVAFSSGASNLVPNDTNGLFDVFVHDRDADADGVFDEAGAIATIRVSVASDGTEAIGGDSFRCNLSADGRFVVFTSDAGNLVADDTNLARDVFRRGPLF